MSLSETSRSHHSSSTSISSSRSDHTTDYHFSQEEADDDNHEYENIRGGLFNSGGSRSFSSTSMSQRGRGGGDPNEEGNNRGTRGEQGRPRYALERSKFKPIIKERCEQYVQVTPVRNYPIK